MEGNEDFEETAKGLDFILEPRPGDYSNLIKRFANYGGVGQQPANNRNRGSRPISAPRTTSRTSLVSVDSRTSAQGREWTRNGVLRAVEVVRGAKKGQLPPSSMFEDPVQDEATLEKVRNLEMENAELRQRLSMLEALQATEAEDEEKVGRFRWRMIKAQNMQLEQEVMALGGAIGTATRTKQEVLAALKDLKQKARELHQMPALSPLALEGLLPAGSNLHPIGHSTSSTSHTRLISPSPSRSRVRALAVGSTPLTSPSLKPQSNSLHPQMSMSPKLGPKPLWGQRTAPPSIARKISFPEGKPGTTGKAGTAGAGGVGGGAGTGTGSGTDRIGRRNSCPTRVDLEVAPSTQSKVKGAPRSPGSSTASSPVMRGTSSVGSSVFGSQESSLALSVRKSGESVSGSRSHDVNTPRHSTMTARGHGGVGEGGAQTSSASAMSLGVGSMSAPKSSSSRPGPGPGDDSFSDTGSMFSVDMRSAEGCLSGRPSSEREALSLAQQLAGMGPPRVAVQKDWLRELDRLCASLEDRLKRAGVPQRWLDMEQLLPETNTTTNTSSSTASLLRAYSTPCTSAEPPPLQGSAKDGVLTEGLKEGGGGKPGEEAALLPFLPGAGNRFVLQGIEGVPPFPGGKGGGVQRLPDNLARMLHGSLPLVQCSHVHELEERLGELHPRLLALSNMMEYLLLPALPVEATSEMKKEIEAALSGVRNTARGLSELAALVPAGVRLHGFGAHGAAEDVARVGTDSQSMGGVPGQSSSAGAQGAWSSAGDPALQRTLSGGEAREEGGRPRPLSFGKSAVSEFPAVDDLIEALGAEWATPEAEEDARRLLQGLMEKLRNAEAKWRAEMGAAQSELSFYRGSHAAQAWHTKQVVSAGSYVLEALLQDAFIIGAAAMEALSSVLSLLEEPEAAQSVAKWRATVSREAPALRHLTKVFPQSFSAPRAAQKYMDPLEKEFRSRMQVVFDKLQSRRASLARGTSLSSPPQTPMAGAGSLKVPQSPGAVTGRLSASPVGRLTGSFAQAPSSASPSGRLTGSLVQTPSSASPVGRPTGPLVQTHSSPSPVGRPTGPFVQTPSSASPGGRPAGSFALAHTTPSPMSQDQGKMLKSASLGTSQYNWN